MKKIIGIFVVGLTFASCSITSPVTATNNRIGDKVGISKTTCVFWGGGLSSGLVLNSNYGVQEAAKKGGITTIATVDRKVTNFLFFSKLELIVTGE